MPSETKNNSIQDSMNHENNSSTSSTSNLIGTQQTTNIGNENANNNDAAKNDNEDEKVCWICFASDDDDDKLAKWVQPCKCRGTTKWVHESCLYRWIDEKQRGNAFRTVNCQQCKTEYIIIFPKMGKFANILESFDIMIKRLSPFLAAGLIVGSFYWNAVTYGAITILQVVGHKKGLALMENSDPLILLIGLPAIPVGLVLGRMIRWEEAVIRLIRNRRSIREFLFRSLMISYTNDNDIQENQNQPQAQQNFSDPISATRDICGALLLPTISSVVGKIFFDSIENTLHKTILGGLVFISVKGLLKIYLRQQQYNRKKDRKIIDYTEENIRQYSAGNMANQQTSFARNNDFVLNVND